MIPRQLVGTRTVSVLRVNRLLVVSFCGIFISHMYTFTNAVKLFSQIRLLTGDPKSIALCVWV